MAKHARIVSDPEICHGQPRIAGTRISVYLVMDYLADGYTFDDIQRDFPHLRRADIEAAVHFAAGLARMP